MSTINHENDSGCVSDDDPTLTLKINKGLSMGYDYELIKSVIQQQTNDDDMSKFIETIVRTAEVNNSLSSSSSCSEMTSDVYIIDGADLAFSYGKNSFSWQGIEICLKYFHSHGHKKVSVVLPYALKYHRYEQQFSDSKILRDLERKNQLIYTNRLSKSSSYIHISEMLKFVQKNKGYLITNVSMKDVILDFTIYKQTIEEKIIRYRFENASFQPMLVSIENDNEENDCERHYPLCPYGRKCTYGSRCKYFHMKCRVRTQHESECLDSSVVLRDFNQIKSCPDQFRLYETSLVEDARMNYEYGLTSTPISPIGTISLQNSPIHRSYSMPLEQEVAIQQYEQNVLRYLSILSAPQQEYSSVNSQEGLAERIQSVRHLWEERENPSYSCNQMYSSYEIPDISM